MIKQFKASYISQEDRLMLRISTLKNEEIRLWLTRLLCIKFLTYSKNKSLASLNSTHSVSNAKAIDNFKQEALLLEPKQPSPFDLNLKLPLGPSPLLIHDIIVEDRTVNAQKFYNITFNLQTNQKLKYIITDKDLDSIRMLLIAVSAKANWTQIDRTNSSEPATSNQSHPIH